MGKRGQGRDFSNYIIHILPVNVREEGGGKKEKMEVVRERVERRKKGPLLYSINSEIRVCTDRRKKKKKNRENSKKRKRDESGNSASVCEGGEEKKKKKGEREAKEKGLPGAVRG